MLTVERHGTTLHFDDDGFTEPPYVYGPLANGRVYEEKFLQHIRDQKRRGIYIDIGAHLGTHTVWFAALCPATHVHAFEPVERNAGVLRRNITANALQDRVTVHQVGLSDRAGQATNTLSPEHQVGFMADATALDETFRIVRLDKVLGREPVAVIKLDVEGMEAAALRGARRILSRWRPLVYAEAHNADAVAEIGQVLAPYGYRLTGQVFNASPTYEFAAPPRQRFQALRPLWQRLPLSVRRQLKRIPYVSR
ncbi:hypothetical protein GCM10020358_71140 [Amorphoplanes nipponensis]|uniref:Methyltransferase FkbM domain-containing protein n=1 Tax=Actinoplanes nipponensis TaxID=135950 RepID=A0A919JAG8_9ACTN|nr:FkbM family methyltransferase [Actinoplanes nipponensis]GIE47098.1 hypothetical protein Ani05nite_06320 [Actinoplanes nipponensis]